MLIGLFLRRYAAGTGDVVIVSAGTYNENLDFGGKAITVTSTGPDNPNVVAATVIDCAGSGRGVYFGNGEGASSVLDGLTITGGSADVGGGIYCDGTSPTIKRCVVSGNNATSYGGGIYADNGSAIVSNCVFRDNSCDWIGGGLILYNCTDARLVNSIIAGNSATYGGGLEVTDSGVVIGGCTFSDNSATMGGAVDVYGSSNASISNSIFWGDSAGTGAEINGSAVVSYSNVEGGFGGSGNIDSDPCFVDAGGGDYHLLEDSPCIDAGDPSYSASPGETDIDGQLRVMGAGIEMGVDELLSGPIPMIEVLPSELSFVAELGGPNPDPQVLSIRNIGAGLLNWEIAEDCDWLYISPSSGESTGETDSVTVSVDVMGLSAGFYNCMLTVSDSNAFNDPQIVIVSLTVEAPEIEVVPFLLHFFAGLGGPNPDPQILSIRNSGLGTLNWEIAEDCDWLYVSPESGESTGEIDGVSVSVDVIGLSAGPYFCELTVSDSNAVNDPQIVLVLLFVEEPGIEVFPSVLEFTAGLGGPNPDPQILSVRNSALGTLEWEITEDCDWLSVNPGSGESTGETDSVTVSVDVMGLSAGFYNCTLTVSDPNALNDPQTVLISLTVEGPEIEVLPSQLSFSAGLDGPNPDPQTLNIRNSWLGTLNWEITEDCNWLSVNPGSGESTGETDSVSVTVDATGLSVGLYNCTLTASDSNAVNDPQIVLVSLIVGSEIEVSPSRLYFNAEPNGPNPNPKEFDIRNIGAGTLNWEITEDCDWLSVTPASGESSGENDSVTVAVDINGLSDSRYDCVLTVSDANALNNPQVVNVILVISDGSYTVVDDMEIYNDSNNLIWDTWLDGYDHSGNGWALIYLAIDPCQPVHSGSQSMEYAYDNREHYCRCWDYSEISREYAPAVDWSCNGEKALVLWFRGLVDNGITPMWLMLNRNEPTVATYGDNGEDPADITKEEWMDWNISLSDFANGGIDLSNVTCITIGFGDWESGLPDGTTGVVYFDDIRLYPARCLERYAPAGDFSGDCLVDGRDLNIMGQEWLTIGAGVSSSMVYDASDYNDCQAKGPSPADGVTEVQSVVAEVVLEWIEGECLGHIGRNSIYFGDNWENVNAATISDPEWKGYQRAGQNTYTVGNLPLWETFYWRINEYNSEPGEEPLTKGKVWSFTTGCELSVSDTNLDCVVNLKDYAELMAEWLYEVPFWPVE
ncbi:MAG: BACON domain-containing protein [Planctomycetota bacterium]